MAVVTTDLLKVKTLSKQMVKQIQVVPLDMKEGSLFRSIIDALKDGSLAPIGWVSGEVLETDAYRLGGFWLVFFANRYYWMVCPEYGELFEKYRNVEQLFV